MSEHLPKSPQELGISDHDWVQLAESLILSREFAALLPDSELGAYHRMRVIYLEGYFGISGTKGVDNGNGGGVE